MSVPPHDTAWSSGDGAQVAAMYHPDGIRHEVAPGARLVGREAIAGQARGYFDAVPGAVCRWRKVIEGTDGSVMIEWSWGNAQDGAPRGGAVELVGVSVCEMEGDLIREERVYWDSAALAADATGAASAAVAGGPS